MLDRKKLATGIGSKGLEEREEEMERQQALNAQIGEIHEARSKLGHRCAGPPMRLHHIDLQSVSNWRLCVFACGLAAAAAMRTMTT